jgi:homoaconitate hydratase
MTLISLVRRVSTRPIYRQAAIRCYAAASGAVPFAQNLVERIVQKYAVDLPPGHIVRSGDVVAIRPEHILTHDNTGAVMSK